MSKTEIQIERDFFQFVKESPVADILHGGIYRRGQRPYNAHTEDCVVKFLSGIDGEIQSGTVILNIYVPYITYRDGRKGEDLQRIGDIQQTVEDSLCNSIFNEYYIVKDGTPRTYQEDKIEQSIIAVRIYYKRLNN